MIDKLKRRIILLLSSVIFVIGVVIVVTINYNSYHNLEESCNYQVERSILFNESNDSNIDTNLITCTRTEKGYTVYYNSTELDLEEVENLLIEIINENHRTGHIDHFYYLNLQNNIRIIDFEDLYTSFYKSLAFSILIFVIIFIFSIYVIYLIARWTVKPVEEAFQKQKMFISDVSHELKTPIAIIQTNTELLQMYDSNKQLDYIAYETGRMNTLITKLLQLTRIETNPAYSELNMGNLSRVVERAAMPFESMTFEKGFKYECQVEENIQMKFNDGLIEQLVTILLDNALKHTKENGKINLTLSTHHHKVILSVKDEGDEISKEDQKKIFERFYRVDQSRNRKDNRYGLGLSIAQSIMEVHEGTIEVNSENGVTEFICKFNH